MVGPHNIKTYRVMDDWSEKIKQERWVPYASPLADGEARDTQNLTQKPSPEAASFLHKFIKQSPYPSLTNDSS